LGRSLAGEAAYGSIAVPIVGDRHGFVGGHCVDVIRVDQARCRVVVLSFNGWSSESSVETVDVGRRGIGWVMHEGSENTTQQGRSRLVRSFATDWGGAAE
jgi:hypothetical protein